MNTCPADVLIVDDEKPIREVIAAGLVTDGVRCTAAATAEEAMTLLEQHHFKLVISDIRMPGMSGLDLLAFVRRRRPHCLVILLTGVPSRDALAGALSMGAYDFLVKPFEIAHLLATVHRALSHSPPPLAARAALAMSATVDLRQLAVNNVQALVGTVEAKDPYTRRHSEQVRHYAVLLARHMGLAEEEIETLAVAALLHDVGKIGIPDRILSHGGPLSVEERRCIRNHPAWGAEILGHISTLQQESVLVRHHHERWDGKGYPDGLSGEEIPHGSRLIGVADSIDAMLMPRVYKPAYPLWRVIDELQRGAGTQFDPAMAFAAVRWCRAHGGEMLIPTSAA